MVMMMMMMIMMITYNTYLSPCSLDLQIISYSLRCL